MRGYVTRGLSCMKYNQVLVHEGMFRGNFALQLIL